MNVLTLLLPLACFALCEATCRTNSFPGLTDKDCYWPLVWTEKSWADAEATCAKYGGHLASVENAQENALIARLMNKRRSEVRRYWLGGRDDANGTWSWSDGRPTPNLRTPNGLQVCNTFRFIILSEEVIKRRV